MRSAKVSDITSIIEAHYPLYLAEDWDNSGLQIGSYKNKVTKAIIALDFDSDVLKMAIDINAELIITHHPMFMKGIKSINYDLLSGSNIKSIINNDITVYSAHTNLDKGINGLNDWLATTIGLKEIELLDNNYEDTLLKLVIYVPVSHLEEVRSAVNNAGSGNIGNYSDCSFRNLGIGTFKPSDNTNPFIGKSGHLEEVDEYRLETVVYKSNLSKVLQAMYDSHPYEEVAYDLYELHNTGKSYSLGRTGILSNELTLQEFAGQVKSKLNIDSLRVVGDLAKRIKTVAVVGGSGASLIPKVINKNVDILITGDVKYHEARDAENNGLAIIDAGHQGTEELMTYWLLDLLRASCKKQAINVEFYPLLTKPCFKHL